MPPLPCLKTKGTPVLVCSQREFDRIFKIKSEMKFRSASAKGLCGFPVGKDVAALLFLFLGMSRVKWCDVCQVLGLTITRRAARGLPWRSPVRSVKPGDVGMGGGQLGRLKATPRSVKNLLDGKKMAGMGFLVLCVLARWAKQISHIKANPSLIPWEGKLGCWGWGQCPCQLLEVPALFQGQRQDRKRDQFPSTVC